MKSNTISVIALVVAVVALFLIIKTQYLTSLQVQTNQGKAAGNLNYYDTADLDSMCRKSCGMSPNCRTSDPSITIYPPVTPPTPGPGQYQLLCTQAQNLCYGNCVGSGGPTNIVR